MMILHSAYGIKDYGRFEAMASLYDEVSYRVADGYPADHDIDEDNVPDAWLD